MYQKRCAHKHGLIRATLAALCALLLLLQFSPLTVSAFYEPEPDTELWPTEEPDTEETEEEPEETTIHEIEFPEPAGDYDFRLNFQKMEMQMKFVSEKNTAAIKYMTENDLGFTRFTALTANAEARYAEPLYFSAENSRYVAISYRASAGVSREFAFAFASGVHKTPAYENAVVLRDIADDGAWHTVVIDMSENDGWKGTLSDLTLYFYCDASSPAGETLDISFIAFYTERPVFENEYHSMVQDGPETPSGTDENVPPTGEGPNGTPPSGEDQPGGQHPSGKDLPWKQVLAGLGIFLVLGIMVGLLARGDKEDPPVAAAADGDADKDENKNETETGSGDDAGASAETGEGAADESASDRPAGENEDASDSTADESAGGEGTGETGDGDPAAETPPETPSEDL